MGLKRPKMGPKNCMKTRPIGLASLVALFKSLHKVTIGLKRLGICLIRAKGVPALSVPKKAKKVPHFFQRKKWGPGLGKALKWTGLYAWILPKQS